MVNFEVIAHDDDGKPVRCSYCARPAPWVVVLPLTKRPDVEERIAESIGRELWVGLCIACVNRLRKAVEEGPPS